MTIDHSIYNNLIRPVKSVADYDNEAMEGQRNKLLLQMERSKLAEQERSLSQENVLSNLWRDATSPDGVVDRNKLYSSVARSGLGTKLPSMQKGYADLDESTAKARGEALKNDELHIKNVNLKMGQVRDMMGSITSPEQAAQLTRGMYADPDLGKLFTMKGDTVDAAVSRIPQDPEGFAKWVQAASLNAEKLASYRTPDANAVLQAKTSTDNNNADIAQSDKNNRRTTAASYAHAGATREVAKATRDAANIRRDQETEMKLGDDYRTQSKGFKEVGDAYRTINATLDQAAKSPAATLAAATKFMKLLDPGSVVRESELGMALAASGVFDRATNYFNVLQSGRVLTPNQVKDFKKITGQIYEAAQTGQRDIDASYTQQAKQYGLRPEMVVQDLGQNKAPGGASQPVRITTDAEHAKLPSGTLFITPDGQTRRKP